MVTTLVGMVQDEWDFPSDPAKHLVHSTVIEEIIRKARLLGRRAYAGLNTADRDCIDYTVDVDDDTGQVGLTLKALDASRTLYGREYTYQFWPDPPTVYIGTVAQLPATFTFRPYSMSLEFLAAVPATFTVRLLGHLVDINQVYAEVGRKLVTKYSQLSNVKNDEFDRLAANTQKRVCIYNTRVIKGFNR